MKIAVCGNRYQEKYIGRVIECIRLLLDSGAEVGVRRQFAEYLGELPKGAEAIDFPLGYDAVASFGGDGTFLRAARWVGDSGIPVLGINTGHLGFLATYSIDETPELIDVLLKGKAVVEKRMLLKLDCAEMPEGFYPYALNEVAILKEDTASMIDVDLFVDDIFIADYMADGLIVATPTGSTAYNLSVGGPILHPQIDCMTLSPVASHTLTLRPMVIGGESHLRAVTDTRADSYRVSVDGSSFTLPRGTEIRISKAPFRLNILRRPGDDFASTLRHKLLWGQR